MVDYDSLTKHIRAAGPDVPSESVQRLKLMTTVTDDSDALFIVQVLLYERHYHYTAQVNDCAGNDPVPVTHALLHRCAQRAIAKCHE